MARQADLYGDEPVDRARLRRLVDDELAHEREAQVEDPFPEEFFRWYVEQAEHEGGHDRTDDAQ